MSDHSSTGTEFTQIVSSGWLFALAGSPRLRLIDARSAAQFAEGHIDGAVNWDMNLLRLENSSEQSLFAFQRDATKGLGAVGLTTGDRVIFYDDFSGASAARGVWLLDYLGIPGGAMLDGGLSAWVSGGGALSTQSTSVEAGNTSVNIQSELLALAPEILEGLSGRLDGVTILDTRSDLEHQIGTIPTSIHLEWLHHLTASGHFRPKEELRELYRSCGMSAEATQAVVTFCGGGYRAAHSYIVLKELGFPVVKNYAPSWGEWGARADVPVQRPARQ